jgi:hypothetical protein
MKSCTIMFLLGLWITVANAFVGVLKGSSSAHLTLCLVLQCFTGFYGIKSHYFQVSQSGPTVSIEAAHISRLTKPLLHPFRAAVLDNEEMVSSPTFQTVDTNQVKVSFASHDRTANPTPDSVKHIEQMNEVAQKSGITNSQEMMGFEADWKDICTDIASVWSNFDAGNIESPTQQWYLIPVKKLYVRSCYKENLEKFKGKRDKLSPNEKLKLGYVGTSGIGKSGFLQLLLISLINEAKEKGVVYSIRLKVFISDRSPAKDWLLHTDGRCSLYNEERVDYYLSDSGDVTTPDLSNVRVACVLATSERSKQFEKLKNTSHSYIRQVRSSDIAGIG